MLFISIISFETKCLWTRLHKGCSKKIFHWYGTNWRMSKNWERVTLRNNRETFTNNLWNLLEGSRQLSCQINLWEPYWRFNILDCFNKRLTGAIVLGSLHDFEKFLRRNGMEKKNFWRFVLIFSIFIKLVWVCLQQEWGHIPTFLVWMDIPF